MGNKWVRYPAALMILVYGFAKLNGSQFTILDSELDKPMGQVSGFWLTWYYFGYSPLYGTFLALIEIVGGLLLTFRRTTLLGACLLAPMLANIILIDICYGVDPGATVIAFLLFMAMTGLIAPRARDLAVFFLQAKMTAAETSFRASAKWMVRIAMVAFAFGLTWWTANYNNRSPTPLDGGWDVLQTDPASAAPRVPVTFFFEYNRAYMVVFKSGEGEYRTHHFDLDANKHAIRISKTWLSRGETIFDGGYRLAGGQLTLRGNWTGEGEITLQLRRRPAHQASRTSRSLRLSPSAVNGF